MVTHQLRVERRTAKERWPETDVLLLRIAGSVSTLLKVVDSRRSEKQTSAPCDVRVRPLHLIMYANLSDRILHRIRPAGCTVAYLCIYEYLFMLQVQRITE